MDGNLMYVRRVKLERESRKKREILLCKTYTYTHKHTLQMSLGVPFILRHKRPMGFKMGLVMDLVYMDFIKILHLTYGMLD